VARAAVAVLALLACAWFAIGVRQAHGTSSATAILSGKAALSPAQVVHVSRLIQDARVLNPATDPDLLRAQLMLETGDRPQARGIIDGVVRREPMNLEGWLWLARASSDSPPSFLRALEHINRVAPHVPAQR
jgi:hypothetical protein